MQAVFEMPDDAVAQPQAVLLENWIQNSVEWKNFALLNMIPDLPADGTSRIH
jgi:hypothetical protein